MNNNFIKYVNRAFGILAAWTILAGVGKAQQTQRPTSADSIAIAKISADAGISKAKAMQVIQFTRYRSSDYARIAAERGMDRVAQQSALMNILSERRRKQDSLLTVEETMSLQRQREPQRIRQRAIDSLALQAHDEQMRQATVKISGN